MTNNNLSIDEVIKVWTTALRSGKYEQTREFMRYSCPYGNKFSCLCFLADGLTDGKYWESEEYKSCVCNGDECLHSSIAARAHLTTSVGSFVSSDPGKKMSLARLNDENRMSFEDIANIIESRPEGLFVE